MSLSRREQTEQLLDEAVALLAETEQLMLATSNPTERKRLQLDGERIQKQIKQFESEVGEIRAIVNRYFRYKHIRLDDTEGELIGRETELEQLEKLLTGGGCVAVLGVGGQGKSALAYNYIKPLVLKEESDKFEVVVWLTVRGEGSDLNELADLLDVPVSQRPEETAETVRQYLVEHAVLLVLDNFESAISQEHKINLEMAALMSKIAELRGKSRVIITSRDMPMPLTKTLTLEGLTPEAGAKLLAEQGLAQQKPSLLLMAAQKTRGHPYALKLLAGLVRRSVTHTLEGLLQEGKLWDKRLAENLLAKIWDEQLSQPEQQILKWLAILRPPVSLATLTALSKGSEDVVEQGLDRLTVDKALVSAEYDQADNQTLMGFDIHPLLRRFVNLEVLRDKAEKSALHQAAAEYFQSLIVGLLPRDKRRIVAHVQPILEAVFHLNELENYQAAYYLFFEEKLYEDLDRWGEPSPLIEIYSQWIVEGRISKHIRGRILGSLGDAYRNLGQLEEAIHYCQQALAITSQTGDRYSEGADLTRLGHIYYLLGQMEEAIEYYKQALSISKEIGYRQGEGNAIGSLGNVYYSLGRVEEAICHYQQVQFIFDEIGNNRTEAVMLGNFGSAYHDLGQVERAIEYYKQALSISEINSRRGFGIQLGGLGSAYRDLGQIEEAIKCHQQGLLIAREIKDKLSEAHRLSELGDDYIKLKDRIGALAYWRRAVEIFRKVRSPYAQEVQGLIDELRKEVGEEEFARLWAESEKFL